MLISIRTLCNKCYLNQKRGICCDGSTINNMDTAARTEKIVKKVDNANSQNNSSRIESNDFEKAIVS